VGGEGNKGRGVADVGLRRSGGSRPSEQPSRLVEAVTAFPRRDKAFEKLTMPNPGRGDRWLWVVGCGGG